MTNDYKRNYSPVNRPADPFGDDEDILDIHCRPAKPEDLQQVSILAAGLLEKIFAGTIGEGGPEAIEVVLKCLRKRLRLDSTWVMNEGDTVIGVIDIETSETRKLNGLPIPRMLSDGMDYTDRVRDAGLLPLLVHEPERNEAHLPIVALLPGSRGEGRGTLLLMHGAFWAKAQGKDWLTAWLPEEDPGYKVYKKRGFFIEKDLDAESPDGIVKWLLLKKPISSISHRELRQRDKIVEG